VHLFGCAQDGVDRAGLDTERATNTGLLVNHGQQRNLKMLTMLRVEIEYLGIEQTGKCNDCRPSTRRALIDGCFTVCNGLGIGSATRVGALSALSLGQQCVDLIDNRIAFNLKRIAA
jgi:hypothetical protein